LYRYTEAAARVIGAVGSAQEVSFAKLRALTNLGDIAVGAAKVEMHSTQPMA
jgi:hypothetical protein